MTVLAIESSCDECSAAIVHDGELLSVCTKTQVVHRDYGGVVPELAGRSHLELIDKLVQEAAKMAEYDLNDIDVVAATVGPGLVGSLLVGASYAKALALSLGIRFRPIHHVEAHLYSAEISHAMSPYPFLVFLASGGHTLLIMVNNVRDYEILGSTLDDALGEAYDKVGKLVGLKFPAGADVDRLALQGEPSRFALPKAMHDISFAMSFSGLKTAFLYRIRLMPTPLSDMEIADLLAAFQETAIESVTRKIVIAIEQRKPHAIVAAGGVAANSLLRKKLFEIAERSQIRCHFPELRFCGDNAAMIGYLAWKLEQAGIFDAEDLPVRPRWPLNDLSRKIMAA
jgi:N6-L-threonylcarbamoyladenine synthase